MSTITWLHLSDLHFRPSEFYDNQIILAALLKDVRKLRDKKNIRPDFIVVSGDIAYSGKDIEYDLAKQFFDELLEIMELSKKYLFLVPGNHDVDREVIKGLVETASDALRTENAVNECLCERSQMGLLLNRFHNYQEFINNYFEGHFSFNDENYFYTRTFNVAESKISILGLNSCWVSKGDNDDRNRILLGEAQVQSALLKSQDANLKIAIMHHPFEWLADFDRNYVEPKLRRECHFILCGHIHTPHVHSEQSLDGSIIIIPAGAVYLSRDSLQGYNIVQLNIEDENGVVYLRRYNDKRQEWIKDIESTGEELDGKFPFNYPKQSQVGGIEPLSQSRSPSQVLSPMLSHPYPMPKIFVGRNKERKTLSHWLNIDNRPMLSMVGKGGMGKSALSWYWLHKDVIDSEHHRKKIMWWSFYEKDSNFERFLRAALEYFGIHGEKEYLFTIKEHLDITKNGAIGDSLKRAFEENNHRLSNEATMFKKDKDRFEIVTGPKRYIIEHCDTELNIFVDIDEMTMNMKIDRLCDILHHNEFLLILDGVERLLHAYTGPEARYESWNITKEHRECVNANVGDFFKIISNKFCKTKTLITTRLHPYELDDKIGSLSLKLTQLEQDDYIEYFKLYGVTGTHSEILQVCDAYGYHPLSMQLLSGIILSDPQYSGDVGIWLQHNPVSKLKTDEENILEFSYNALKPGERQFIKRFSSFQYPMDYNQLKRTYAPNTSKDKFMSLLQNLNKRNLVLYSKEKNTYSFHPVVRRFLHEKLKSQEEEEEDYEIEISETYKTRIALVGLGQGGGNIVNSAYLKSKCLQNRRSEYALLYKSLIGSDGRLNVWSINTGKEVLGLRRSSHRDGLDPDRAILLGEESISEGAGGSPGRGRYLYEKYNHEISATIYQVLNEKPEIVVVAFTTSGGTGSSFGPRFVYDLAMNAKNAGNSIIIIPLIILPPDKQEANTVTSIVSLGTMAKLITEYYDWKNNIEMEIKDQSIIPMLFSNEQILNKLGQCVGPEQLKIPTNILFRLGDSIPADFLAKLLFIIAGWQVDPLQLFVDPADIARFSRCHNPFTIPFLADFSTASFSSTSIEQHMKSIADAYILEGCVDAPFINDVKVDTRSKYYFEELYKVAEREPITISGLFAPMGKEPNVEQLFAAIYGKNPNALQPDNIKKWINMLGEVGVKIYYPETQYEEPVTTKSIISDHYILDLGSKINPETGERMYPDISESEAYLITFFGGATLEPLEKWIKDTEKIIKISGPRRIQRSYGLKIEEIQECIDALRKTWNLTQEVK